MSARPAPVPNRFKVRISALEAELAFCDALITFAGQIPDTIYQRAQIRVYKTIENMLSGELAKVKEEARARTMRLSA